MGGARSKETTCCGRAEAPVRVAISGAAGQVGYSLLPMIAQGDMFGPERKVCLQCLDFNKGDTMRAMEMELRDGNFPLLQGVRFFEDPSEAFAAADYAILLGAFPNDGKLQAEEVMKRNVMLFETMGVAIEHKARMDCKILLGKSPANTNALICAHFAPSVPKENFFALARLDQHRATAQIATRAKTPIGTVKNVVSWGCDAQCIDLGHATVKGKPALQVLSSEADTNWLAAELREETQQRGTAITAARKASSAMSTARAIVEQIHDLSCGTATRNELASLGAWTGDQPNEYGIAGGLIYSMPHICRGRNRYHLAPRLKLSADVKEQMKAVERTLLEERAMAEAIFKRRKKR